MRPDGGGGADEVVLGAILQGRGEGRGSIEEDVAVPEGVVPSGPRQVSKPRRDVLLPRLRQAGGLVRGRSCAAHYDIPAGMGGSCPTHALRSVHELIRIEYVAVVQFYLVNCGVIIIVVGIVLGLVNAMQCTEFVPFPNFNDVCRHDDELSHSLIHQ